MKKLKDLKILCIGDSITEALSDERGIGWPGRLQRSFAENPPKFFNLGIGGETVGQVFYRIQSECITRNPDILMIACGTNDHGWIKSTQEDVEKVWEQKMIPCIKDLKQKGIESILLNLTYKDTDYLNVDENNPEEVEAFKDYQAFKKYNEYLDKMTKENNFNLIDVSNSWSVHERKGLYYDAVHLTGAGYDLMAKNIYKQLVVILKNLGY